MPSKSDHMTDHLPERLAALGADPEVYRAELELASTLAQIPAGWHVEYDGAGETLLYYGTAMAGRIIHLEDGRVVVKDACPA